MKKLTSQYFIEKSKIKHNDFYDYSKSEYINSRTKITIICPLHDEFSQMPNDHIRGSGCPKCGTEKHVSKKRNILCDLIKKANDIHHNLYDYSNIDVHISMHYKVKILCKIHGEFYQTFNQHINNKRGCPKCGIDKHKDTLYDFIRKANLIHLYKYNYSKVQYINSRTKIIICPIHGDFSQKPKAHINSEQGCPKCNQSKCEIKIGKFLDENAIAYEYQKKFNDCKYKYVLPFDFYLSDYNICIEFDGEQHFKVVNYWGGEDGYLLRKDRDKIKTEYCINNNIKLIRIPYNVDFKDKLNNILKELKPL